MPVPQSPGPSHMVFPTPLGQICIPQPACTPLLQLGGKAARCFLGLSLHVLTNPCPSLLPSLLGDSVVCAFSSTPCHLLVPQR